jgi:putative transposase
MAWHRKKRRFIDEPGHAHFFTFSCAHRWPLLKSERSRGWLVEALEAMRVAQSVQVWAYVIMPEHVHLLLKPTDPGSEMRRISAAIKYPVSCKAHQFLQAEGRSEWVDRLTVQKGDRSVFQFWQPGTGFDENLWTSRSLREVVDYIHANPVRRGLAERPIDWEWSSAKFHAGLGAGPISIDPIDWS